MSPASSGSKNKPRKKQTNLKKVASFMVFHAFQYCGKLFAQSKNWKPEKRPLLGEHEGHLRVVSETNGKKRKKI
jgi:hypothetical protein